MVFSISLFSHVVLGVILRKKGKCFGKPVIKKKTMTAFSVKTTTQSLDVQVRNLNCLNILQ